MAKKVIPPANPPQPDPDDDDGSDEGAEFSPKQLELINNTITAAVSSHVKRQMKPLQEQIAGIPSTIQQTLEQLATGGSNAGAGADDKNKGAAGGTAAKDDPEKVAMKKRLDAIEAEREQERANARHARRDQSLVEIATKAGVDKNRLRGAVALLREQVKFDSDGNPLMTVKRHGLDEDVTIEDGATEFFKTDEGKSYLAPTQPVQRGGSGSQRGATNAAGVARGASSNAGAKNAGTQKQERQQKAAEDFVGAVGELFGGGNVNVGG